MSRAALWKQEESINERKTQASENFQRVCEEGRNRRDALPLWGNDDSFHLHPVLLRSITQSVYFQKICDKCGSWSAVIDEIYYEVKNIQPFSVEKAPSTAFCLLLRLLTLRMSHNQLQDTLSHPDSPYIRAIGFLYLRYVGEPESMDRWIQPYLLDDQELATGRDKVTLGEFVRTLFDSRNFQGTLLPRLPSSVEQELRVQLLQAEQVGKRGQQHYKNGRMQTFRLGARIMALYGDNDNPIRWYEAVIDRVITRDDETGTSLRFPKYVVTFPQYGNTETVSLGEIDTRDGDWRHERLESRDKRDLYDQVRRRDRDFATGKRQHYDNNPADKKMDLRRYQDEPAPRRPAPSNESEVKPPPVKKQKTAEELAAIAEKKRKLLARYG